MKRNIVRFSLSCVLFLMIGAFLYYIWTVNNTATSSDVNVESSVANQTDTRPTEEPKRPYKLGAVTKDQAYCNGELMDIYHPRVATFDRSPVVMYLHGGGWEINDKNSETDQLTMIDGLRDKGYTVASINYRKLPENFYPDAVEDSLCAVRYLRAKADIYGLNPNKVAVYGFSAGGYLAAMVGALPDDSPYESSDYSSYSSRVNAVVTLAGIFDFTDGLNEGNRQRIANFLNGVDPQTAEVSGYITPEDPSFLLLHGADDQYVPVEQDNLLAVLLQQHDISYEQIYVTNAEHGLNAFGGEPIPDRSTVKQRIAVFIRSKLEAN